MSIMLFVLVFFHLFVKGKAPFSIPWTLLYVEATTCGTCGKRFDDPYPCLPVP